LGGVWKIQGAYYKRARGGWKNTGVTKKTKVEDSRKISGGEEKKNRNATGHAPDKDFRLFKEKKRLAGKIQALKEIEDELGQK